MNSRFLIPQLPTSRFLTSRLPRRLSSYFVLVLLLAAVPVASQVLTVDTSGKKAPSTSGPVNREYTQIEPTHVELPSARLDEKSRLLLIRVLQSEQGFAMRPLPRGHRGLTLEANGKLNPAGEAYLNEVVQDGISAKPGERVVISDLKIEKGKIEFELNGGPDAKHRFLSHVSVGVGMGESPVVDDGSAATGSRLTLTFDKGIPALTGAQVKALLAPLISFDVKTPIQAFTDTLPKSLKDAILDHQALVGMSTDMLVYAKGQPVTKSREMDGQMPFEEWIYGTPPEDVVFVRVNGNRVIRVEIAKNGQKPVVYTDDVVSPMLLADGKPPVSTNAKDTRTIREGDVEIDPNKQAATPLPTLGKPKPGEDAPVATNSTMRPVQPPKPHTDDTTTLGADPDDQEQPASAQPTTSQPSVDQTASKPAGAAN